MLHRGLRKALLHATTMLAIGGAAPAADQPSVTPGPGSYLFVWSGDSDEKDSDFLAVVDVRASSPAYGSVVATLPVGATATMPHHIEYEYPSNHLLFVNGWKAGRSFIIDLRDPLRPKLAGDFTGAAGYSYPHSFARLPNGNVAAVFQSRGNVYTGPGGLLELDNSGKAVRAASSATPDIPNKLNWPYSLAVHPSLDRIITTSTDMGGLPVKYETGDTNHVQLWSKSGLKLLASVPLPPSPAPNARHHVWPAEPRVLADGSVYVNTFNCGLYRLSDIDGAAPKASFVHAFPGGTGEHDMCAVPVVAGKYWVQTVAGLPGLIVLDISDPARPIEVSRLRLDPERYHMPHWLSADRASDRLVVTGSRGSWVLMVRLDPATGQLAIDERFKVNFDRTRWPHGATGPAWVHGAVFNN
ncbi:MAG TPA: hypothetical protein VNJ05_05905 [Sphingomicrobium sp.]|nr:hypothetical protein [Sphingomicrobium sp.]